MSTRRNWFVSVSAYNDADLLDGCLHAVRDALGNVPIQVVDGRYETWPEGDDNSTDETPSVAADWGAEYVAGGPYDRERDKHVDRVKRAPDGRRALFLDADERLLEVNKDALDDERKVAYQPRIFNALVYGPRAVYWPRGFYPETVESINRWDAYLFDAPCEKTDAITIVHRHDLRDRDYREAKYERFDNENREGRYDGQIETYLEDEWAADMDTCPRCRRESLTRSQVTGHGPGYSSVEACVAADGCHATVNRVDVGEWRYLPDDWRKGMADEPERLRLELMDAGCEFVRDIPTAAVTGRMQPVVRRWIREELGDGPDADTEPIFT